MTKIAPLVSIILLLAACGTPAPEPPAAALPSGSQEGGAIVAQSRKWENALNARDIETLVGLYTSDARVMAPNAGMTSGAAGVRDAFGFMIEAGWTGELRSLETRMAGDIAYNVGTYRLKAGNDQVDQGKFIEIWRKVNGEWRIASDIWNSDLPAAARTADVAMFISHDVADVSKWSSAWRGENSRHDMFLKNGAASVQLFQDTGDPNHTGLAISVSDMEKLQGFIGSPQGTAAAAEDGVDLTSLTVFAPLP